MILALQRPSNISFRAERHKNGLDIDVTAEDVGLGALATAAVPTATGILKTTNAGLKTVTNVARQGNRIVDAIPRNTSKFKNLLLNMIKSAEKSVILKPFAKLAMSRPVQKIAGVFGGGIAVAFCVADVGNIFNTSADLARNYNDKHR